MLHACSLLSGFYGLTVGFAGLGLHHVSFWSGNLCFRDQKQRRDKVASMIKVQLLNGALNIPLTGLFSVEAVSKCSHDGGLQREKTSREKIAV